MKPAFFPALPGDIISHQLAANSWKLTVWVYKFRWTLDTLALRSQQINISWIWSLFFFFFLHLTCWTFSFESQQRKRRECFPLSKQISSTVTVFIPYLSLFFYSIIIKYNYTQLSTQKDLHYITLVPVKQTVCVCVSCGSVDWCSALFHLLGGDQPACVFEWRRFVTKDLWRLGSMSETQSAPALASAELQIYEEVGGSPVDRHYLLSYRRLLEIVGNPGEEPPSRHVACVL